MFINLKDKKVSSKKGAKMVFSNENEVDEFDDNEALPEYLDDEDLAPID